MQRLLLWIGIGIFFGWSIAILVNFSIYQHSTEQWTFIHPIVDGIMFMALMLVFYLFIWRTYKRNTSTASKQIAVLGGLSFVLAIVFII
ncbi:hypothetical protein ACM26V_10295 [Salipaludibacillus sp. HK11]|uniref:hypothetical protein n=1 Tax=Salipaludibacillus sp. HK11 TaxID=3394320 RepID=UPI0039FD2724